MAQHKICGGYTYDKRSSLNTEPFVFPYPYDNNFTVMDPFALAPNYCTKCYNQCDERFNMDI